MTLTNRILALTDAAPAPLPTTEIRRLTGGSKNSVIITLRRLEADGLVKRMPVPRPPKARGRDPVGWIKP